ncbi:MAG: sulfatase-like hydrolase/transferase, partial [Ktedonobacterales bacterium]|nr:sulfatase-like hydrolase/transferase [Ktedonobacterales bacterium]
MPVRMNVVFLMPDQLRPDFLSCYGADFIQTPHIDSLCAGGTRYARAISPSPLCVPMRASLLTGQNTIRTGVLNNYSWLRPDHTACGMPTWPEMLAAAGYTTAGIGKMHFYPWDSTEGFAYRVIAEDKRHIHIQDDYARYLQEHGHKKYHGNEHAGYHENKGAIVSRIPAAHQVDTWVAAQACAFIEGHPTDSPFAMMVGFPGPHCPYDPPAELAELFDPDAMPASIPATA